MKKILFGCGAFAKKILRCCTDLEDYFSYYVDNDKTSFGEKKVYRFSEVLEEEKKDNLYIIIMVDSEVSVKEIKCQLINEFGIQEENIENGRSWLARYLERSECVLYPRKLRIDVCSICQLNCRDCYMRNGKAGETGTGYLTVENFLKIIELNPLIESYEISNSGEVFLNPELPELLKVAYENNKEITISNGVNLNCISDEVVKTLVETNVKTITVSIDGATQQVYEKYRRNGKLSDVLQNIRKIQMEKERQGKFYPRINWQYVLMAHNECDIENAIELAAKMNMKIQFKLPWGEDYHPADKEKVSEMTGITVFSRDEMAKLSGHLYGIRTCEQLIFSPQINWDGKFFGCCSNRISMSEKNAFFTPVNELMMDEIYRNNMIHALRNERMEKNSVCNLCSINHRLQ